MVEPTIQGVPPSSTDTDTESSGRPEVRFMMPNNYFFYRAEKETIQRYQRLNIIKEPGTQDTYIVPTIDFFKKTPKSPEDPQSSNSDNQGYLQRILPYE